MIIDVQDLQKTFRVYRKRAGGLLGVFWREPIDVRAVDGISFSVEVGEMVGYVGPNGAGKSSLLDAITWALWGKARARRDEELVHLGQQDMHVQLDFEQEGTIYRVIRRRTRKSGGSGMLDLFVVDGASFVTCGWQNPTMTILALSMRASEYAADQLKKRAIG